MALPTRRREAATSRPAAVWQPFRHLGELQRRTADLMGSVWSGLRGVDGQGWVPAVDLEETDEAWIGLRVPRPEQPRPRRVAVQA